MRDFPPIEDHGLIGDLQTAALVSTDGTVDWMCLPRFDSPSIFASLLDRQQGGYFRVSATGPDIVSRQMYLPGTPILITRFMSVEGVGEVIDFMPVVGKQPTNRHKLVRLIRAVRGRVHFEAECSPRFDYGREEPAIELHEGGAMFRGSSMSLSLSAAPERAIAQDVVWSSKAIPRAHRTASAPARSESSSRTPETTGATGLPSRTTADGGARWWNAPL
jgi:GH15 family glucan-1,4-alpha-glucosidase